jgi:Leucine-rich repeat (LRR) protein
VKVSSLCICAVVYALLFAPSILAAQQADSTKSTQTAAPKQRKARPLPKGYFTSLDSALAQPDSVLSLVLTGKGLSELPQGVEKMKRLALIELSGNAFTTIPKVLCTLPELGVIMMNQNQIITVPNEIGNLKKLSRISLRDNEISSLPASIGQCTELTQIDLHNNPLTTLPVKELTVLKKLRTIGIGGSELPVEPAAPAGKTEKKK